MYKYGLEIELIDFNRNGAILPEGCVFSPKEVDLVNSDGRAVNPLKRAEYTIGGEVGTPPTPSMFEQVKLFSEVLNSIPNANVNFRCQLHTHISREPNFTLEECKHMLTYIKNNFEAVNKYVWKMHDKLPTMKRSYFSAAVSKIFNMPQYNYDFCMKANTMEELRRCWYKAQDGREFVNIFRRYYVNVYSLWKHGTIEFRIFRPTLDPVMVKNCLEFSKEFLIQSLTDHVPVEKYVNNYDFPVAPPFNSKLEQGYQNTKVKTTRGKTNKEKEEWKQKTT